MATTMAYPAPRTIAKNVSGYSYGWTIPSCGYPYPCSAESASIPVGHYIVQVCRAGTDICDSSDNYFKIINTEFLSSVTVISPNGGEYLVKGYTQTISWSDTNNISTHEIKLVPYYAPCGSNTCPAFAYHEPYTVANTQGSSYSWSVGDSWSGVVPDGKYTIQVCQSSFTVCDSSDSFFTIGTYPVR